MTHVDIDTEEIYGCEEESLSWYHEKGHIAYSKSEHGQKNIFAMESSFIITIFMLVLTQFFSIFRWLALAFMGSTIIFYAYEEVWCWNYAKKEKEKERENIIKEDSL